MNNEFKSQHITVSMHALDRFSLRVHDKWTNSGTALGIMSWLKEESSKAYDELLKILKSTIKVDCCRITKGGVTYVFNEKFGKITLVTVYSAETEEHDFVV